MEVRENKTGNYLVINLSGRLDSSNYGELEKKIIGFIFRILAGATSIILIIVIFNLIFGTINIK